MKWQAHAPSNIALIKYMGKYDSSLNLPDNPSLSYTLNTLLSTVTLEVSDSDRWESLSSDFSLPEASQLRFINHLNRIKNWLNFEDHFLIRSGNNFPHGSGLASSASSFAALTRCAVKAICDLKHIKEPSLSEQAGISRQGSGSSCRSFFNPWALWDGAHVESVDLPYSELHHEVILIHKQVKKISSSEAHQMVKTSPLWINRIERANLNLNELLASLQGQNWAQAFKITWSEFQDMHRLFQTAAHPFSYLNEESENVLKLLQTFWDKEGDGPLVTMDAGPNIHLLYRPSQKESALRFKKDYLQGKHNVL